MSYEKLIRIPSDRIGALIGKSGKSKKLIEDKCSVSLDIDSEDGQVLVTSKNVGEDIKSGGKHAFLRNFGEIVGIFQALPEINSFVKNMNSTIKLVFGGAKTKKIRDKGNLNKALEELNLSDI